MLKRNIKTGIVILVIAFLFAGLYFWQNQEENGTRVGTETADVLSINVTVTIEGILEGRQVTLEEGDSVFDLLTLLNEEIPSLNLQTKEYEGLGILVVGMGDRQNGDENKYWQYYVNDILPMVGAQEYILKEGDSVLWAFAESEF